MPRISDSDLGERTAWRGDPGQVGRGGCGPRVVPKLGCHVTGGGPVAPGRKVGRRAELGERLSVEWAVLSAGWAV